MSKLKNTLAGLPDDSESDIHLSNNTNFDLLSSASSTTSKDISANFTWQHQEKSNWCWAVVGSHMLSYAFGNISTEDVVKSKYGDLTDGQGSVADVKNYFDTLQKENSTSHTWTTFTSGKSTALTRIKACLNNDKPIALRITYVKSKVTKSHQLLCVGYTTTSSGTTLKIYDSGPETSKKGIYFTGIYDTSDGTFTAGDYGECTCESAYFITKKE